MNKKKKITLVPNADLYQVIRMAYEIHRRDQVDKGRSPSSMNGFLLGIVERCIYETPGEVVANG
jgi:hypothetical protein